MESNRSNGEITSRGLGKECVKTESLQTAPPRRSLVLILQQQQQQEGYLRDWRVMSKPPIYVKALLLGLRDVIEERWSIGRYLPMTYRLLRIREPRIT